MRPMLTRTFVVLPGVELLVKLRGVGQTFRIEVFGANGVAGTYSFTNTALGDVPCNPDGEPVLGSSG